MNDNSIKFLYRKLFEIKLLKSTGDAFQQFVYRLLNEIHPTFIKIETQGATGDRKMMDIYVVKVYFFKSMVQKM